MTQRAKLFEYQDSQAVRLPEEFRFEGQEEISIYRQGDKLVLEPMRQLQEFVANHRRLDLRELRGTGGLARLRLQAAAQVAIEIGAGAGPPQGINDQGSRGRRRRESRWRHTGPGPGY